MKQLSNKALSVKPSSTLVINAKANELKSKGKNVINFGAGEPDFDTPTNIKNKAIEAIEAGFTKYTNSSGIVELREAICDKLQKDNNLKYNSAQITVSNGAKQALHNIFTTLLDDGDEVIIPAPYWLSYTEMVRLVGGTPIIMYTSAENNYKITEDLLEKSISQKTKAIIINSPNNPTGIVYSIDDLRLIGNFAVKNDLYIISDEIYEYLIYDNNIEHVSIASLSEDIFERTIVINGFSKSYSMTGWRVGYTASSLELSKIMTRIQSHQTSNINSITQKAAFEALIGDQNQVQLMCEEFAKRRDYIYDRVTKIKPFKTVNPQGAFYIFIDISELCGKEFNGRKIKDSVDLAEIILEESEVAVVPCIDFGFEKHIRLSYSVSIDVIKEGMDRIEKFISKI